MRIRSLWALAAASSALYCLVACSDTDGGSGEGAAGAAGAATGGSPSSGGALGSGGGAITGGSPSAGGAPGGAGAAGAPAHPGGAGNGGAAGGAFAGAPSTDGGASSAGGPADGGTSSGGATSEGGAGGVPAADGGAGGAGSGAGGAGSGAGGAGGAPDVLFETAFDVPGLAGWEAHGAGTVAAERVASRGGSARVAATFSGEQYGSFTYHFDTPQDFTGGRVFFPFHVENVAGPVWFSVYVLSGPEGAYSSTSRAYFETIPAEGSALQVDLATMTSEPPEVDQDHIIEIGLQFGAGGWDSAGVLEFFVDEVRVER